MRYPAKRRHKHVRPRDMSCGAPHQPPPPPGQGGPRTCIAICNRQVGDPPLRTGSSGGPRARSPETIQQAPPPTGPPFPAGAGAGGARSRGKGPAAASAKDTCHSRRRPWLPGRGPSGSRRLRATAAGGRQPEPAPQTLPGPDGRKPGGSGDTWGPGLDTGLGEAGAGPTDGGSREHVGAAARYWIKALGEGPGMGEGAREAHSGPYRRRIFKGRGQVGGGGALRPL